MKNKLVDKIALKKNHKKCYFCKIEEYDILDVHRIVAGEHGGEYTEHNTVVICANCHRLVHSGKILIDKKYNSTKGVLLHYWIEGKEYWN